MNFNRIILGSYAALFVGLAVWAVGFFVQMQRDLTVMKAQETANRQRLAEAQRELAAQDAYLDKLRHDPALIEDLIRKKLGYARSQEFLFRFEEGR